MKGKKQRIRVQLPDICADALLSMRDKDYNIWQMYDLHFSMDALNRIFLDNAVEYLREFYDLDIDVSELEMEPGWLNIDWKEKPEVPRGKGGYRFHHHIGSKRSLGGVYYINAEENDSGHFSILDPRSRDENHYKYSPKSGEMLIFPDWMMHRPEVSNSSLDNPRLSIATNISFKFEWPKELIW